MSGGRGLASFKANAMQDHGGDSVILPILHRFLQVTEGCSSNLLEATFSCILNCENNWHIRCGGDCEHCFAATGARPFPRKHPFFLSGSPLFSISRAFFQPSQELFGWQCAL